MGIFLSKSVSFNPSTNIPSLEGKVILVTGGNSGLGKESVLELSKHKPKEIWLAARQVDKANEAIEEIKNRGGDPARIKVVQLDLCRWNQSPKRQSQSEHRQIDSTCCY